MSSSRWYALAAAAAVLVVAAGCSSGVSNSKFNAEKARAAEAEAAAKKKAVDLTAKLKGTEADGKETYDRLTFDLAEVAKELAAAKKKAVDLTAKLKGTEADGKETIDSLRNDVEELEDEKAKVEQMLTEKTAKLKGTEADGKETIDSLRNDVEELKDEKAKVEQMLTEKTAKLKGTEADGKETIDSLRNDVEELKDEKAKVEQMLTEKTAKLKGTEADGKETIDSLRNDVEELKDEKAKVEQMLTEKTAELSTAQNAAADVVRLNEEKIKAEADVVRLTGERDGLKNALAAAKTKVDRLTSEAAMVRFGFIVANPGEVFYAINTASNGATVPITLKKTDDGLKLGGFGEDLDETKLRLPAIADFVGAEFRDERADEVGGTTKIRAVSWSDVKTLSTLGDAPLYSGGDKATARWDWNKVDSSLKRPAGDGSEEEEYVVEAGSSVQGTYANVPGVFTCERDLGGFCSSTGATSDGSVFKFTPKADYLSFGAWMSKSSAEGNAPSSPVVGVFAVGGSLTPIGGAENDTGTATYKGGATGFYAKREVGAGAGAGAYTADVELRADFENEGIVSGSVTNFQEMRTGTALGWSVKLDRAKIDTTKKGRPFEGGTSSQANFDGDEKDLNGKWEGKFYGQDASSPLSAAGTFNARTGDPADGTKHYLSVIGAFGAKKEMLQPSAQ